MRCDRIGLGTVVIAICACTDAEPPGCVLETSQRPIVVDLATSEKTTLALLSNGRALCWGDNGDATCGFPNGNWAPDPLPSPAIQCAKAVALETIGVGLHLDGGVFVWGRETENEFGDGPGQNLPFGRGGPVEGLPPMAQVAAGGYQVLARTQAGEVYGWGYHMPPTGEAAPSPIKLDFGGPVVDVAPQCVVRSDGQVLCWQFNSVGQLGDGTYTPRDEAAPVLLDVTATRVHRNHSGAVCAELEGGRVACWGDNGSGILGVRPDVLADSPIPIILDFVPKFVQFELGEYMACIIDEAGVPWCWGSNALQMIQPEDPSVDWWEFVRPAQVHGIDDAIDISVGSEQLCVLRRDHSVFCAGAGDLLGLGEYGTGAFWGTPDIETGIDELLEAMAKEREESE